MKTNPMLERVKRLEMAFLLFLALATGEQADASAEEKEFSQKHLAQLCEQIKQDL